TADIEGGYASAPDGVADTVKQGLAAGAVGINIEDGPRPVADHCARIAAARKAGSGLFINARTDTYLRGLGDPGTRLSATLERAACCVPACPRGGGRRGRARGGHAPRNRVAGAGPPRSAPAPARGAASAGLGAARRAPPPPEPPRRPRELFRRHPTPHHPPRRL